jgi:hypothetical protein
MDPFLEFGNNHCAVCAICARCAMCPGGVIPTSIALVVVDAVFLIN